MSDEKENPYDDLYVDEEPLEFDLHGITFVVKAMSTGEYLDIVDDVKADSKADYMRKVWEKSVLSPKDLDLDRLKPDIYVEIVGRIEELMGMSEDGQKN